MASTPLFPHLHMLLMLEYPHLCSIINSFGFKYGRETCFLMGFPTCPYSGNSRNQTVWCFLCLATSTLLQHIPGTVFGGELGKISDELCVNRLKGESWDAEIKNLQK